LDSKERFLLGIQNRLENLFIKIKLQGTEPVSQYVFNILSFNKIPITLNELNSNYTISLEEPKEICCLYGDCKNCCDSSCSNKQFPILFVHGHKFNKDVSADSNLHSFEAIQKVFDLNGYINSGFIFSHKGIPGIWNKFNMPISLTMSYYFDTIKSSSGETMLESKKDSIDTYALRLNDIIREVKQRTGKEKVILITHSMGGLVARKYLQIFGEESVEKLILIMTPNNGIYGKILSYCNILGSEIECNEMNKDSIFINKLNNQDAPKIPVYNIIGLGCDMDGEQGDGVVTNSTAYLPWAKNYYLNGTCNDLSFTVFHTDITYPNKYPELIELLKQILNESV
jgi:pimeloyl-ACP methyl ester carboxylesterase